MENRRIREISRGSRHSEADIRAALSVLVWRAKILHDGASSIAGRRIGDIGAVRVAVLR